MKKYMLLYSAFVWVVSISAAYNNRSHESIIPSSSTNSATTIIHHPQPRRAISPIEIDIMNWPHNPIPLATNSPEKRGSGLSRKHSVALAIDQREYADPAIAASVKVAKTNAVVSKQMEKKREFLDNEIQKMKQSEEYKCSTVLLSDIEPWSSVGESVTKVSITATPKPKQFPESVVLGDIDYDENLGLTTILPYKIGRKDATKLNKASVAAELSKMAKTKISSKSIRPNTSVYDGIFIR